MLDNNSIGLFPDPTLQQPPPKPPIRIATDQAEPDDKLPQIHYRQAVGKVVAAILQPGSTIASSCRPHLFRQTKARA